MHEQRTDRRRTAARRGALLILALVAWLAVSGVGGPLVGRLSEVQSNDNASFLPKAAEATEVNALAAGFTSSQALPYFLVVERPAGLTATDRAYVAALAQRVPDLPLAGSDGRRLGEYLVPGPVVPVPSADGKAALLVVNLDSDRSDTVLADGKTVLFRGAEALRDGASSGAPAGLTAHVTGPGGIVADLVSAFSGIDGRLLGVALLAVFVILLLVYRSPVLPLAVLLTSLFGLSAAALAVFPLAKAGVITVNGQAQGILFILVVGAATDYSLLLVARYREELHDHESKYVAMRRAWRASVEPIVGQRDDRGARPALPAAQPAGLDQGPRPGRRAGHRRRAAGRAHVAAGAAARAGRAARGRAGRRRVRRRRGARRAAGRRGAGRWCCCSAWWRSAVLRSRALRAPDGAARPWYARPPSGRWLFWPRIPHVDHVRSESSVGKRHLGPDRRPGRPPSAAIWMVTAVCLAALAAFAPTFAASGISKTDLFRDPVDSVAGQKVLAAHFPAGSGTPGRHHRPADRSAARVVRSPSTASPPGPAALTDSADGRPPTSGPPKVVDGQVQVAGHPEAGRGQPGGRGGRRRLRTALDQVGPDVLVGGTTAMNLDVREASRPRPAGDHPGDPGVILLVLTLLLRALVAPLLLIVANVLSFGATSAPARWCSTTCSTSRR